MKIYLLTEEYNTYNQNGEYFIAAFAAKPNGDQLLEKGVSERQVEELLKGDNVRAGTEGHWFTLREEKLE